MIIYCKVSQAMSGNNYKETLQWVEAQQYFKAHPNELLYPKPSEKDPEAQFISIDSKLYRIGEMIDGTSDIPGANQNPGVKNNIFNVYDTNDNRFILKEEHPNSIGLRHLFYAKHASKVPKITKAERARGILLAKSEGANLTITRENKRVKSATSLDKDPREFTAQYSLMPYLGTSIKNCIQQNKLSKQERLDAAFRLCYQLHTFHKQFQAAHGDINLSNVCHNEGQISLIDFEKMDFEPTKKELQESSPGYFPYDSECNGYDLDTFALMRCLSFPAHYVSRGNNTKDSALQRDGEKTAFVSLLPDDIRHKNHIKRLLNTEPIEGHAPIPSATITPLYLSACMAIISLKLDDEQEKHWINRVENNPLEQELICELKANANNEALKAFCERKEVHLPLFKSDVFNQDVIKEINLLLRATDTRINLRYSDCVFATEKTTALKIKFRERLFKLLEKKDLAEQLNCLMDKTNTINILCKKYNPEYKIDRITPSDLGDLSSLEGEWDSRHHAQPLFDLSHISKEYNDCFSPLTQYNSNGNKHKFVDAALSRLNKINQRIIGFNFATESQDKINSTIDTVLTETFNALIDLGTNEDQYYQNLSALKKRRQQHSSLQPLLQQSYEKWRHYIKNLPNQFITDEKRASKLKDATAAWALHSVLKHLNEYKGGKFFVKRERTNLQRLISQFFVEKTLNSTTTLEKLNTIISTLEKDESEHYDQKHMLFRRSKRQSHSTFKSLLKKIQIIKAEISSIDNNASHLEMNT